MKLIKHNYPELIFYLLNILFILVIFYPLFFVTSIWLGDEESYLSILETEALSFISGRFLMDVLFITITMVPICIINIILKIVILEIEKKGILVKVMCMDFIILIVYSLGLVIGKYGVYLAYL